jgi:hypothetical protein
LKTSRRPKKTLKTRKKTYALICLTILAIIILSHILLNRPETTFNPSEKKAAIIDGLSTNYENNTFWWTAQDMLQQAGYTTYYYQGGSDTVDLYRSLATKGFEIIILRVHSALNPEKTELALFTNEKWDDNSARTTYLMDILNDRLIQVGLQENSTGFFGIRRNFVTAMEGKFENTIIIMMGCDGLKTQSMAEAFTQKGAKTYIAWDGPVTPQHVDEATIRLLQHLVLQKQTISEAVAKTVEEVGNDPYYGGTLRHYP